MRALCPCSTRHVTAVCCIHPIDVIPVLPAHGLPTPDFPAEASCLSCACVSIAACATTLRPSTGGALATLAAAWASFEYPRADIRCVTFGSPRTGNVAFSRASKYLVGSSYRLMHAWDPIPTVPPPKYFQHVKGRFWLRSSGAKSAKRPWCTFAAPLHGVRGLRLMQSVHELCLQAVKVMRIGGAIMLVEHLKQTRFIALKRISDVSVLQHQHAVKRSRISRRQ